MRVSLFILTLAPCPYQAHPQSGLDVQRKDSVTVSKEQLRLEDELNHIIAKGNEALRSGKAADAVKQYERALDLVHRQPLLAERENYVLDRLGNGYVQSNRAKDAIPIYSKLVAGRRRDCEEESAAVSSCADIQYRLGMAQMFAGNFQDALGSLREAAANHAKAEKLSDSHESKMVEVKEQAETNLWIAAALVQLGKSAEATPLVEAVIPQLLQVKSDESISTGIRDDANRSLQDAQTFLGRLKPALPDLSGTWKLNPSMSKTDNFGFDNSPDVLVVKHLGASLSMRHWTSPLGGQTYSYVIDGKEHLASFTKKNEFTQARAYWDGNTLVIEKHHQTKIGDFPWPEIFVTSRYSLSADGKILSVVSQGNYHDVLIYDKQ